MKEEIKKELARLESEHEIKVLYAVESGSRAWGFASTNSDWDVRFIYLHKPEWYLSIEDKKDSIDQILPNDIDLGGWEFKKAMKLFIKSNPPLMEWLNSPIVYQENGNFADSLRNLSVDYFSPKKCLHHYLHMAEGNYRDYLQREMVRTKKYFYVLRPILACEWIEKQQSMPPTEFLPMLNLMIPGGPLRDSIDRLLERKKNGEELAEEPRISILNNYLEERIAYYQEFVKIGMDHSKPSNTVLNELFRNSLRKYWYPSF